MDDEEKLGRAISRTHVLRPPRQALATFGVTSVVYYLVTQPAYAELLATNCKGLRWIAVTSVPWRNSDPPGNTFT